MKTIRTLLACLRKADATYNLINHGDKIVVGLSGGKDSVVLLYLLNLYQKFSHTNFTIQPVILDLGFEGFDPTLMQEYCKSLGLELMVNDSREVYKILKAQQKDDKHLPCSICSRMKKAAINKVAMDLGYNKVAFAHHADDAIETKFMNEIYGGRVATFAPKMHLERADITFIRPLILCREKDISSFIKEEKLPVSSSCCPADKLTTREDIKIIISDLYKKFPEAKQNFLKMLSHYEKFDLWDEDIFYQVNNDNLTLKPVLTPNDNAIATNIRHKVFVEEMKFPYEEEFVLENELNSTSFLIYKNDNAIGTIRYRLTDYGYKMERFAILKEYRHLGYGSLVIKYFIDYIFSRFNPTPIYMHAVSHLKDFYSKFDLIPEGDEFIEAGVKHIKMVYKKKS